MEDARLLEKTFEAFCARGAALGPEEKEKYRKLSSELSLLSLTFDQNALKDKNRYELLLTKEDELEGLPESIREAAALRAKEKGKTGWLFNLSAPSYVPFMRYSALRGLREKMYREYMSIGNKGDEYDNKEIIRKIVNIRLEIARLMGYANYADYKLKHTMAKTPARVYKLLNELLDAYKPVARNEYETVQRFASETEKENITVMPWDWSYYSKKLKDLKGEVLVVTNAAEGNTPHVVEDIEPEGGLKTRPLAGAKPSDQFMRIDRNVSILETFFLNMKRQFERPSDFRFYHLPADLLASDKELVGLFKQSESNSALLDEYRLDTEQYVQSRQQAQQQSGGGGTEQSTNTSSFRSFSFLSIK
jgi:hypothetical protein